MKTKSQYQEGWGKQLEEQLGGCIISDKNQNESKFKDTALYLATRLFVRSLLQKQKESIVEEIEDMRNEPCKDCGAPVESCENASEVYKKIIERIKNDK